MFKKLFTSLCMLLGSTAYGEWRVGELDRFAMEVSEIGDLRDPYFPYASPRSDAAERWRGTVATEFDLAVVAFGKYGLFSDNRIMGDGTNKQFRTVSWEWTNRLQISSKVHLFHHHISRHVLEATSPYKFPLYNNFGVSVEFYKRK
jgi:hypothetical protein